MRDENLAPDEREAVLKLLRDTIAADKFPLSPRIRTFKSALAKLDPAPCNSKSPAEAGLCAAFLWARYA